MTRSAESHTIPVQNNVPFLQDGFSVLLRIGIYNEQSSPQDLITIDDATSGNVFKINTTGSGKWEATVKGSDAVDYRFAAEWWQVKRSLRESSPDRL